MTREEAINEIKSWAIPSKKGREVLETLIPELRESEDERIRKALVIMIKVPRKEIFEAQGITKEQALAYLERPKEPINPFDTKLFQDGVKEGRRLEREDIKKEQKPVDEKTVDEIGKSVRRKWAIDFIRFLDEHRYDGKMCVSNGECMDIENAFISADWEKLIRYYNKYTQKPVEWSEEDERIIRFYEADYNNQIGDMSMKDVIDMRLKFKDWLVNRLKDLRPSWKPSEEQILAIVEALKYLPNNKDEWMILDTLIDVLKKLM